MPHVRARIMVYVVALVLIVPLAVPASESCSMMGGKCRDACERNETAEAGDFLDCGSKQECCIVHVEAPVRCCAVSQDSKDFGPSNCVEPVNGVCPKGAGSPVPCSKFPMCAPKK